MINFNNTKFVKSSNSVQNFIYDQLPQVVFVGRSNVGKSSIINMLTCQKRLAKTSGTPGHTRLVNYYNVDNKLYLVDLPGYGFASGKKSESKTWDSMLNDFFCDNQKIKLVFILLDIRRDVTAQDIQMQTFLYELGIDYKFVLTKADKLSNNEKYVQLNKISEQLRHKKENLIITSAEKKYGKNEIFTIIDNYIES